MAKQVCDCGTYDFPDRKNNTFFLFPRFNNKFAPCEHLPTLPPAFILGPSK